MTRKSLFWVSIFMIVGALVFLLQMGPPSEEESSGAKSGDWRNCPNITPYGTWEKNSTGVRFVEDVSKPEMYRSMRKKSVRDISILKNKWLYFYGDSTVRQIASQFLKGIGKYVDLDFVLFREFVRSGNCSRQPTRENEVRYSDSPNEARCDFSPKVLDGYEMTFDWKHFAYQNYDEYLMKNIMSKRKPDLFIFSFGLHDCYHKLPYENITRGSVEFFRLVNETLDIPIIRLDAQAWIDIDECTININKLHHELVKKYNWLEFNRYPSTRLIFDNKLNRDNVHLFEESSKDLFHIFLPQILCALFPQSYLPQDPP